MRVFYCLILCVIVGCSSLKNKQSPRIIINEFENSQFQQSSFRGLDVLEGSVLIGGSENLYGIYNDSLSIYKAKEDLASDYRAVAQTSTSLFLLRAGSPAQILKIDKNTTTQEIVYKEDGEKVFYDALQFVNDSLGFAFGDEVNGCMSLLKTKDAGNTWEKISCRNFLPTNEASGAFAASNSNIASIQNNIWLAARRAIYYSNDYGLNWVKQTIPMENQSKSFGLYSIDFYDENLGIGVGGDYANPALTTNTVIITTNGGKTWKAISDQLNYRSCVQFVPNKNGKQLLAVGFNGISFSNNGGKSWSQLSNNSSFYSFRFITEQTGVLVGKQSIASFNFK